MKEKFQSSFLTVIKRPRKKLSKEIYLLSNFILLYELFQLSSEFLIFLSEFHISVMVICHLLLNLRNGSLNNKNKKCIPSCSTAHLENSTYVKMSSAHPEYSTYVNMLPTLDGLQQTNAVIKYNLSSEIIQHQRIPVVNRSSKDSCC